jgi:hypothetical protein
MRVIQDGYPHRARPPHMASILGRAYTDVLWLSNI